MRFQPKAKLTLAQHAAGLRKLYPNALIETNGGTLTWRDRIRPMALARTYLLELQYKISERPKIRVLEPNLIELSEGRRIEHLYSQEDQELCVYYPDGVEWNSGKALANTVVLWAHEWLIHFEAWLFTGHWDGGGTHPTPRKKPTKNTETGTRNVARRLL